MNEPVVRIEQRDAEIIIWVDDQCEAVFETLELAQAWVDGFQCGQRERDPSE